MLATPTQAATVFATFQDGVDGYAGTRDTSLVQESPNNNYGDRVNVLIGAHGSGRQRAGVIGFDVTSLNGLYSTIASVKLEFTVGVTTAGTNTWQLNLLREGNADWVEGSSNGEAEAGTATWNKKNTANWLGGNSGARLATDVYGSMASMTFTNGSTVTGNKVMVTLDPSSLDESVNTLDEMMNLWSGGTNAGIQIYGGSGQWSVDSKDNAVVANRPKLIVEYTPIPEPHSAALLGLGGVALVLRRRK